MLNFLNRLSFLKIFFDHYSTLYDDTDQSINYIEILLWILLPLLFGCTLVYLGLFLNSNSVNMIVTIFSILTGFLINCLVLLASKDKPQNIEINKLNKETFQNTSYGVLVSFITIFLCLILYHTPCSMIVPIKILTVFVCMTSIHSSLTILMVIKRLSKIVSTNMN